MLYFTYIYIHISFLNLELYCTFCRTGMRSCHSRSGRAGGASNSRMGRAAMTKWFCLFHNSSCAWLDAIRCPSMAAFITLSMKAFTFLFTHYVPIMLSSGLSSRENKMTCPFFVIQLCSGWRHPAGKVTTTLGRVTCVCHPDTVATDPHCPELRGQRWNVTITSDSNNETWQPQRLKITLWDDKDKGP